MEILNKIQNPYIILVKPFQTVNGTWTAQLHIAIWKVIFYEFIYIPVSVSVYCSYQQGFFDSSTLLANSNLKEILKLGLTTHLTQKEVVLMVSTLGAHSPLSTKYSLFTGIYKLWSLAWWKNIFISLYQFPSQSQDVFDHFIDYLKSEFSCSQ